MSAGLPDPSGGTPPPSAPKADKMDMRSIMQKSVPVMIRYQPDFKSFLEKFPAIDLNMPENNGEIALHTAVCYSQETLDVVLAHTKNINHQDDVLGYTPLHKAVSVGAALSVKKLVAHGADLTVKDVNGQTALDLAQALDHREIQSLLGGAVPEAPAVTAPHPALTVSGRFKLRMK